MKDSKNLLLPLNNPKLNFNKVRLHSKNNFKLVLMITNNSQKHILNNLTKSKDSIINIPKLTAAYSNIKSQ